MTQRIAYAHQSPKLFQKFLEFSGAIREAGIDQQIYDLVDIRASQLNGCAFCLDMHVKEAKIHGERELRLHHVSIWRASQAQCDAITCSRPVAPTELPTVAMQRDSRYMIRLMRSTDQPGL